MLEQFEKLEAEESREVKKMAEMVRMTPKPKARGTVAKTPLVKLPKNTGSRTDGDKRH